MKERPLVVRMIAAYLLLVLLPTLVMGAWFILRIHRSYEETRIQDIRSWAKSSAASINNTLNMLSEHAEFVQNYGGIISFLEEGPYGTVDQLELWFSDINRLYNYLLHANSYVNNAVIYTLNDQILNLGGFLIYAPEPEGQIAVHEDQWSIDAGRRELIYRRNIYDTSRVSRIALFELHCTAELLCDAVGTGTLADGVYLKSVDGCYTLGAEGLTVVEEEMPLTSVGRIQSLGIDICISAEEYAGISDWTIYAPLLIVLVCSVMCTAVYSMQTARLSSRIQNFARHIASPSAVTPYQDDGNDEVSCLVREYNHMLATNSRMLRQVEIAEVRQHEANFRALQSQINPHFIYNTLETARMTAEMEDTETTSQILCALGQQLRYTLAKDTAPVTLAEEVENVRKYLYIQKLRMDDRLRFSIEMDAAAGDVQCPRFLIQPLVENAVLHGVEPRPEGGEVRLQVGLNGNAVCVLIEDDGVGMTEAQLEELRAGLDGPGLALSSTAKFNGLGMNNVYQRMKYLYKDDFDMILESPQSRGFRVSMNWKKVMLRENADRR